MVQDRRSCTWRSSTPFSRAFPIRETSSGERYSGKIVMTSSRIASSPIVELALVCFGLGNLGLGGIEQTGRRCHHEPAGGQVDLRHDLPNERDEYVGAVRRIVAADSNKVVAWQVHHLRHRADGDTRR